MSRQNKPFFGKTDRELITRFLLGGGALGLSTGATVAVANHLKQLTDEKNKKRRLDDDVLTIKVRRPKKEETHEKYAMLSGGIALGGGVIAGLGSYALVQKIYQQMKKKRLQRMLDDAQVSFADSVSREAEKSASRRPMAPGDFLAATPAAAAIMLMLGSGALANSYLRKSFPTTKDVKPTRPRKVVLKYVDEEEGNEKKAYFNEDAAFEHLVKISMALNDMHGYDSDLSNIVNAFAQGRGSEVSEAIISSGVAGLDLVKGASVHEEENPLNMQIAVARAVRDPVVGPAVKMLASAEFMDMAPAFSKLASALDEETQSLLNFYVAGVSESTRVTEKQAVYLMKWAGLAESPETDNMEGFLRSGEPVVREGEEMIVIGLDGQQRPYDPERDGDIQADPVDPEAAQGLSGVLSGVEEDLDAMDVGGVDSGNVEDSDEHITKAQEAVAEQMGAASANEDVIDQMLGG